MTCKTTITRSEYLQIVGLLTLASEHEKQMAQILVSLGELTGETDPRLGHCCDAIYNGYTADDLLKKIGLSVV